MTASITSSNKKSQKEKERFVSSLMARMTLKEKIAQLNLVTPTAGTGPFKTKIALEKLNTWLQDSIPHSPWTCVHMGQRTHQKDSANSCHRSHGHGL